MGDAEGQKAPQLAPSQRALGCTITLTERNIANEEPGEEIKGKAATQHLTTRETLRKRLKGKGLHV